MPLAVMESVWGYVQRTVMQPGLRLVAYMGHRMPWQAKEPVVPKEAKDYIRLFIRMQTVIFDFSLYVRPMLQEDLFGALTQCVKKEGNVTRLMDLVGTLCPANCIRYNFRTQSDSFLGRLFNGADAQTDEGRLTYQVDKGDVLINAHLIRDMLSMDGISYFINQDRVYDSDMQNLCYLINLLPGPYSDMDRFRAFNALMFCVQMSMLSRFCLEWDGQSYMKHRKNFPHFAFLMNFVAHNPDFFRFTSFSVKYFAGAAFDNVEVELRMLHGDEKDPSGNDIAGCAKMGDERRECFRLFLSEMLAHVDNFDL